MGLGKLMLNSVKMSSMDAMWILLHLGMSKCSRQVTFVPALHLKEQARVHKQQWELVEEADSTNVE